MSGKIGRNAPCPCGSGKKFKKCCLEKETIHNNMLRNRKPAVSRLALLRYEKDLKENPAVLNEINKKVPLDFLRKSFNEFIMNTWNMEKVGGMSTSDIIEKLESMNVDFKIESFKKQTARYISAIRLAEECYYTQDFKAIGPDEDFIWLAICELWKRLTPRHLNIEMIDDAMQEGYADIEHENYTQRLKNWESAWQMIKTIVPRRITSVIEADAFMPEPLTQSIFNWCQDFETELYNAGLKEKEYLKKTIRYCREFCEWFSKTDGLIIQNMLRTEAEAYALLGDIKTADKLFEGIIKRFPDSAGGYVGWGDIYSGNGLFENAFIDYNKAEKIYRMGLERCRENIEVIYERLEGLKIERNKRPERGGAQENHRGAH